MPLLWNRLRSLFLSYSFFYLLTPKSKNDEANLSGIFKNDIRKKQEGREHVTFQRTINYRGVEGGKKLAVRGSRSS